MLVNWATSTGDRARNAQGVSGVVNPDLGFKNFFFVWKGFISIKKHFSRLYKLRLPTTPTESQIWVILQSKRGVGPEISNHIEIWSSIFFLGHWGRVGGKKRPDNVGNALNQQKLPPFRSFLNNIFSVKQKFN